MTLETNRRSARRQETVPESALLLRSAQDEKAVAKAPERARGNAIHLEIAQDAKQAKQASTERDPAFAVIEAAARRLAGDQLLRLSAEHLTAQEEERRRIAGDLHDGIGQTLGLLLASLQNVGSLLREGQPDKAAECVDKLQPKVRDALDELRRIAMNLRPATLDSLGILATLSWHLREIGAACPSLKIDRRLEVAESEVPDALRTPIFRILQEACSNAIRHGGATRLTVDLSKSHGVLELAIEDNGRGFDPEAQVRNRKKARGLGLQSMRERAELSEGACEIRSIPEVGTRVSVKWPVAAGDADCEPAVALKPSPRRPAAATPRDHHMLQKLSVCVACARSIKGND